MHHDALTGLNNLTSARREIERAKQDAKATESQLACCCRHRRVLPRQPGFRLRGRRPDTAGNRAAPEGRGSRARIRGALRQRLLPDLLRNIPGKPYVEDFARRISDAILQPYTHQGQNLQLSVKIGAVVFPDPNNANDQLLRHADEAIVRARNSGGCFFVLRTAQPARAADTLSSNRTCTTASAMGSSRCITSPSTISVTDCGGGHGGADALAASGARVGAA